ncbi:uncharacterized protein LOC127834784 [Dreissena polymorpha]|nr:uncharacterized protein LOC127834784 [Dreissena polymorpha]
MIIKAIQEVLEEVFQLANEECERQWKELERALKMQSKNELYPDHTDAIRRLRWTTVQFVVDTVSQMWHKIRADLRGFARQIQPFVDECARIGCLMSLHEPRIVIIENARSGTDVNENVYDKLSPEGNTVEFVVWPALMITNGHVIAKGVVQCYRADPRHNLWQTHSSVV